MFTSPRGYRHPFLSGLAIAALPDGVKKFALLSGMTPKRTRLIYLDARPALLAALDSDAGSWENTGAPVSAEQVADIRAAAKNRVEPWTAAALGEKKAPLPND